MTSSYPLHESRPPDLPRLLGVLGDHEVRYVISGSVAAMVYGVELVPGDLDVVPAPDRENLTALAAVVEAVEGRPPGPFGAWETQPDGERKWIARPTTPEELEAWRPDPDDVGSFDHLLHSRYGNLDLVPEIMGTYHDLMKRAKAMPFHGTRPWVAHIDEVLARMTVPRREKDVPRVAALRRIQSAR